MRQLSITPSITVTIGRHTRIYYAFVTTAPPALDSPNTITLDERHGPTPARLVLVDAMELAWQRARIRGNHHLFVPADPVLVGLNTLQHWLWQRLQAPIASPVAA